MIRYLPLLCLLVLAGCHLKTAGPKATPTTSPVATVQPFTLKSAQQEGAVQFDPDSDGATLVAFWSPTWNPEHEAHLELLTELHERYGNKGLRIIAIAYDEKLEAVQQVLQQKIVPFEVALGTQALYQRFEVEALPTLLVVAPGGALIRRLEGLQTAEELKNDIKPHLAGRGGNR